MDVFNLFAKLTMDSSDYDEKMGKASDKAHSFGDGVKKAFGVATAAIGAAVGAASTAVGSLVKSSVEAYADYEQLTGGVETLFKDSADTVMRYAYIATSSAGLTANEYMETVTSFSASLLQSLGGDTEQAAQIADMAIRDMSDNANKMGTDMSAIQNAYQGFAKQNYTMLDNLKLGYGGTKSEMERLLADATKLSGVKYDIESLSDVYEAIHVIQTELDITGTTAKEASTTISGSLAAAKAAWQNLVMAFSNPDADIGALFDEFIANAKIALGNLLPAVEQALSGVSQLISYIAPTIAEELPSIVQEVLPPLLSAAGSLVKGLVSALPSILSVISSILPNVMSEVMSTIFALLPELVPVGVGILKTIVQAAIDNMPLLLASALEIITALSDALIENLPELLNAGLAILKAIGDALVTAIPQLAQSIASIITALTTFAIDNLPIILDMIFQIVVAVSKALIENAPVILKAVWDALTQIATAIWSWFDESVLTPIGEFFSEIWDSVTGFFDDIWKAIKDYLEPIYDFFEPILSALGYLFDTIWTAIKIVVSDAAQAAWDVITNVWNSIKTFVDEKILNPLKEMFSAAWNAIYDKIEEPLNRVWEKITDVFNNIKDFIDGILEEAANWGKDLIDNFVGGIRSKIESVGAAITGVADKIRGLIGFSEPEFGPLSNFHTFAPDMLKLFAEGIRDNEDIVTAQFEKAFDFRDMVKAPQVGFAEQYTAQPIDITLEIDGEVLARKQYRNNQREAQRHGGSLVYA